MFQDAESYKSPAEANLSFKIICMEHFRRIIQLASTEFRGGYWTEKVHKSRGASFSESIYIPDTRESYNNAIDIFYDLLLPIFDKKAKDETKRIKVKYNFAVSEIKDKKFWIKRKLELQRELFQQLSLFLARAGYLEGKSFKEKA